MPASAIQPGTETLALVARARQGVSVDPWPTPLK